MPFVKVWIHFVWSTKNRLCKRKFGWQDEYFAVSVSEAVIEKARTYIAQQETHHRTKSFDDEFNGFMQRAGFQKFLG